MLKKLLEEDALTLRELAAKTGKSTGVLDQAVKKLIKKKILIRENINDTPKYILKSFNNVLKWMEEDVQIKQQMLKRKHENFETFIRSLTITKARPEMEFFEGSEGIKKAYMLLLQRGNDFVQYGPTRYLPEEDPLRDFRVQYFRDRRNRGIFSRVITHDTALGRRFKSRDIFEYRRTILVDSNSYIFNFEKVIAGDTVACFQLEENKACFIKYPELAQDERHFFERIWNMNIEDEKIPSKDIYKKETQRTPVVPFKTQTFSQLREFFLSKKSIVAFAMCGLLAAAVTYGLYYYNIRLSIQRIQDRALSIAVTGALQFNIDDLNEIQSPADITKPQYTKIIQLLNEIRRQNEDVAYAYLLRPGDKEKEISYFIADADSIDITLNRDINLDGKIDEKDEYIQPGDISNDQGSVPLVGIAYEKPTAFEPYHDPQWGNLVSGWAPIKDGAGKTIAIFCIDVFLSQAKKIATATFIPEIVFLVFFVLFIVVRLAAFNRSILKELFEIPFHKHE